MSTGVSNPTLHSAFPNAGSKRSACQRRYKERGSYWMAWYAASTPHRICHPEWSEAQWRISSFRESTFFTFFFDMSLTLKQRDPFVISRKCTGFFLRMTVHLFVHLAYHENCCTTLFPTPVRKEVPRMKSKDLLVRRKNVYRHGMSAQTKNRDGRSPGNSSLILILAPIDIPCLTAIPHQPGTHEIHSSRRKHGTPQDRDWLLTDDTDLSLRRLETPFVFK